jgi:hypothetical protein
MKRLALMVCLTVLAVPAAVLADIYRWEDANGVMHFSNEPPPAGARVIEKTEEMPYNPAADRQRVEEERRTRLEYRQLEVEERKVQAAAREREAQLRLEQERSRQLEEMARSRSNDGGNETDDYLNYGTYYGPGYYRSGRPGDPNLYRWYYRDNNNLYYKDPRHPWPPGPPPATPPGTKPTPPPGKPARTPSGPDEMKGSASQPVTVSPK